MHLATGKNNRSMSEINVTPMVDIMLVLLIIFMVTAPLIQQGVAVKLPTTQTTPLEVDTERAVLTLTRDKRVFLGKAELPLATLRKQLQDNIKLQRDKELYLRADRDLAYGFVVDIMAILREVGIENLGMVTDPTAASNN